MLNHVVTARIYTGGLYFLCLAASGKLGGWCTEVKQALKFNTPGEAESVFEGFCVFLQAPNRRNTFDPDMLAKMQTVARLIELGVGHLEAEKVVHHRHRILDITPPGGVKSPVIKLSNAA
jgi:hypothetical protein